MQQREIISGLKHFGCVNIFIPVKKIYKNQIMNQNSLSCERVFVGSASQFFSVIHMVSAISIKSS